MEMVDRSAGDHSAILYLQWFSDVDGKSFVPVQVFKPYAVKLNIMTPLCRDVKQSNLFRVHGRCKLEFVYRLPFPVVESRGNNIARLDNSKHISDKSNGSYD